MSSSSRNGQHSSRQSSFFAAWARLRNMAPTGVADDPIVLDDSDSDSDHAPAPAPTPARRNLGIIEISYSDEDSPDPEPEPEPLRASTPQLPQQDAPAIIDDELLPAIPERSPSSSPSIRSRFQIPPSVGTSSPLVTRIKHKSQRKDKYAVPNNSQTQEDLDLAANIRDSLRRCAEEMRVDHAMDVWVSLREASKAPSAMVEKFIDKLSPFAAMKPIDNFGGKEAQEDSPLERLEMVSTVCSEAYHFHVYF